MNKGQLNKYFNHIENGRPINWAAFLQLAEQLHLSETRLSQIFRWKKIKGGKYQISILDQASFWQLKAECDLPNAHNRVTASLSGNSHHQRVSGSLLNLLGYAQTFPHTLVFDAQGNYYTPIKLHHNLLIVENLENFLALVKQPDLLGGWLDGWQNGICQGDILFADGNAVSNKLHQPFFARYDSIQCLLDIDLGGFEIFKNIASLVADKNCHFILSQAYLDKYVLYGRPISTQEYHKLLARSYPQALNAVINMVRKYKKFAEQEILLWN